MIKATLTSLRAIGATIVQRAVISTPLLGIFVLIKRLLDEPSVTDADVKAFGKVLGDTTLVLDEPALTLGKALDDSGTVSEALVRALGLVKSDGGTVTDLASLEPGKALSDAFSMTDDDTLLIGKRPSDSASFTDTERKDFTKLIYGVYAIDYFAEDYVLTDVNLSEQFAKFLSRALGDSAGVSDLPSIETQKNLSEALNVTDDVNGAAAGDDQTFHFFKALSEGIAHSDAMVLSSEKALSESPGVTDAGSARGQNYSSFDYFAEDYVGYSWTF